MKHGMPYLNRVETAEKRVLNVKNITTPKLKMLDANRARDRFIRYAMDPFTPFLNKKPKTKRFILMLRKPEESELKVVNYSRKGRINRFNFKHGHLKNNLDLF